MKRAYYSKSMKHFLKDSDASILGELVKHHQFSLEALQKNKLYQKGYNSPDEYEQFNKVA